MKKTIKISNVKIRAFRVGPIFQIFIYESQKTLKQNKKFSSFLNFKFCVQK